MESIFDILYIPMGFLLRLAYSLTNNYLAAIFLFTLVFELILAPLSIKQQKNSIKQALLAPKAAAIRKKYAGRSDQATQQKMQNELMDMYQAENFNPMGGCGTLLIQFPIIICLYNVVTRPLRYICNLPTSEVNSLVEYFFHSETGVMKDVVSRMPQIDVIKLIRDDVPNYYPIAPSLKGAVIPDFTVGPFDLSRTPEISFQPFDWLMLIPVVTFLVMLLSTKIMQRFTYQPPEAKEQANSVSMKILNWSAPLLSVYFEFQIAAAVGVYWIFRNILNLVQQMILAKVMPIPKYSEEEYKAAERELMGSSQRKKEKAPRDPNKPKVRSLHHIDDEGYDNGYKIDPDAPAEEEKPVGETTDASNAPAPIKNDDKTSYTAR